MKYVSYRGTRYQKTVTVPERKMFNGKRHELAEVFANYAGMRGHESAKGFAEQYRSQGCIARTDAHSGYTAVYVYCKKKK